jgi:hypothetical protein
MSRRIYAWHEANAIAGRDSVDAIDKWREESYLWRATAEELARQLGKVEYAQAEYENQKAGE